MVNQLNQNQLASYSVQRPENPQSFTNTASSHILNSFFNVPCGMPQGPANYASNQTSGPSTQKNS